MKKLTFIFTSLFILNIAFAKNISLPNDFSPSCFEQISQVQLTGVSKVVSPLEVNLFVQNNQVVPWKMYKKAGSKIDYNIDLQWDKNFLQDKNYKTYLSLDTEQKSEINISFDHILKAWTFQIFKNMDYPRYHKLEIYISTDGQKYSKVANPEQFDLKYLKIKFIPTNENIREKIKIYDMIFYSKNDVYIVDAKWQITAYAKNLCKSYLYRANLNGNFQIDKNTPIVYLKFQKNTSLNPNISKDSDGDKIPDLEDNCPTIYNPMQKDKNADGVWDACSDVDKDGIIWNKDNCPYTYNPDQKDVNNNKIWDACEFDKDKDGIFDSIDNCITTPNLDQKDDDHDGIWNACDNCKYYNPQQLDKNHNGIWDVCEEKEKYLKEHDKDKDKIIDSQDNCPLKANPDQKDSDDDGVWDACDNCPSVDNPNQKDENKNGKWDMCEDIDKDGFVGYQDNCPYISNPKQEDQDNDGIWNVCEDDDHDGIIFAKDNCPYDYNPDQKDTDKDGIWDKCDKKDDRFLESNKYVFIWLIIVLVLWFGIGIWTMIRKIKE